TSTVCASVMANILAHLFLGLLSLLIHPIGENTLSAATAELPKHYVLAVLICWPGSEVTSLGFGDPHVVDAGSEPRHQPRPRACPQLVAVAAVPLSGVTA